MVSKLKITQVGWRPESLCVMLVQVLFNKVFELELIVFNVVISLIHQESAYKAPSDVSSH